MRIAIASDHRGDAAAEKLAEHLTTAGHAVRILGPTGVESRDYPDAARDVGTAVRDGASDRGVLICGSGIGMAIAANKIEGVRAVNAHDPTEAEMSRRHNDANVLCLGADRITVNAMFPIADTFLATEFEGGRHQRRVEKLRDGLRSDV